MENEGITHTAATNAPWPAHHTLNYMPRVQSCCFLIFMKQMKTNIHEYVSQDIPLEGEQCMWCAVHRVRKVRGHVFYK